MKRKLVMLCASLLLATSLSSQEAEVKESSKEPGIVFFSDEVPRYQNLALGVFISNQYGLGGWADFAPVMLGGGIDIEYALPLNLRNNIDFGLAAHIDYTHIFPKKDSTLKRDDDIGSVFSLWLRIPFLAFGQRFALQPEIGYGAIFHNAEGQNGSNANGWYIDQVVYFAPSVRWIPPRLDTLEIELVWHIDSFIKEKKAQKEEEKKALLAEQQRLERERQEEEARRLKEEEDAKRRAMEEAADEAERQRIAEELRKAEEARKAAEEEAARIAEEERLRAEEEARRIAAEEARRAEIASWPNPTASLNASGAENFTPDGDGMNDTIVFSPKINYIEETPESWQILIKDPQGHDFKTFKGSGALPESLEWDGKSDRGENVVSKNTYTAYLTVTPSRTDRLRTKELTAETDIKISTGLILEVIVPEHEWKIVVQTIAFDPDAATFDKLSEEQAKANHDTLNEVAQQIKSHTGAKAVIEGYANNISGTEKENVEELIPLSQKRAEAIVEELVKRGIDPSQLEARGMGGANPLASRRDKANWWKNRRVEFRIKK